MLVKIQDNLKKIQTYLYSQYGEGYTFRISYCDINNLYVANVGDKGKAVKGYLFDTSLNMIETPIVEQIDIKDNGVWGVVDGETHQLSKQEANGKIIYVKTK